MMELRSFLCCALLALLVACGTTAPVAPPASPVTEASATPVAPPATTVSITPAFAVSPTGEEPLQVMVSILPQKYFVERVGVDRAIE